MCKMAKRIKERRIKYGLTQEELAEKLGLKKSAIAKYENGRVENIKRTTIEEMAKIFECNPSYLMGWAESDTTKSSDSKQPNISFIEEKMLSSFSQLNGANQKKSINYTNSLLSAQQMEDELLAAHSRTDVDHTPDGQKHDLDIMGDDGKWK